MKKAALMYDFDITLSPREMQDFTLLPLLGLNKDEFFKETNTVQKKENMDIVLSYLYVLLIKAKEKNLKITKEMLNNAGRDIDFYPGVLEWFDRINTYGKRYGIEIEHYVISSGMKEIIEGTKIAKNFKKIYACEFHYDKEGLVDWINVAVNYTNKTQFIYRINKGALDVSDDEGVNRYMPHETRPIPYTNMIYIGDGMTDIPCMKLVKSKGGTSIAVYEKNSYPKAEEMFNQKRINFCAPADFRLNSELDKYIKKLIRTMGKTV